MWKPAAGACLSLALIGCASFPQSPKSVELGQAPDRVDKPSVYLDMQDPGRPMEQQMTEPAIAAVRAALRSAGAVSGFAKNQAEADRVLELNLNRSRPSGGALLAAAFTGATLLVVPSYSTNTWTLAIEARDSTNALTSEVKSSQELRTWYGIWLLPAMGGNQPKKVRQEVVESVSKDAVSKLVEKNSFYLD